MDSPVPSRSLDPTPLDSLRRRNAASIAPPGESPPESAVLIDSSRHNDPKSDPAAAMPNPRQDGSESRSRPERIASTTIEFHSPSEGTGFRTNSRYIATTGQFKPFREVRMPFDQIDCLAELQRLRYETSAADARDAQLNLGRQVLQVLGTDLPLTAGPLHLDLVSNAEELWALPFEACLGSDDKPVFVDREPPVILTRRVRNDLPDHKAAWPTKPRVLFITVVGGPDLAQQVIDDHRAALLDALAPWVEPLPGLESEGTEKKVLTTLLSPTLRDVEAECRRARAENRPYTHVHIFAHGVEIVSPKFRRDTWWGLDLQCGEEVGPRQLAQAIAPSAGLPAVVTVAACDSASADNPLAPGKSIAQELHRSGVPVVIAAQLPFQKWSTVVLARTLYPPLLSGGDVRRALHAARSALYRDAEAGHDWLGMVAYVRLPGDYTDRLLETALEAELGMLETASRWAGALEQIDDPDPAVVERTENALRERIASLQRRIEQVRRAKLDAHLKEEVEGLFASAHKRLAQFLFDRGEVGESITVLEASRDHYYQAYKRDFGKHWPGVQWLSLDAILNGTIDKTYLWHTFVEASEETILEDPTEFWACGTLAELYLLAPLAGLDEQLDKAKAALECLLQRVREQEEGPFPIASTRRQLRRYTTWWTKANGFFESREGDLLGDASELLRLLE